MRFGEARNFVAEFGVGLVTDPRNRLSGIGVGRKNEGPITEGDDFCVSAFVERKFSDSALRERGIRDFHAVVGELGVRSRRDADVVELGGPLRLHSFAGSDHAKPATFNTQKWFLAPRSGVSIANPFDYPKQLTAGTLGFVVEDGSDHYLVSNNHVLARENAAKLGEDIIQPGTSDLNGHDISTLDTLQKLTSEFKIAELAYFHRVNLSSSTKSLIDAAMAKFTPSTRSNDSHARHGFGGRFRSFGAPYPVDSDGNVIGSAEVTKVGRTSGHTEGYVTNVVMTVPVEFAGRTVIFNDQLAVHAGKDNCGSFSTGGDSGAAVVNHDHEIVGLLFAGGPRRSLANRIDEVIKDLQTGIGKTLQLVK